MVAFYFFFFSKMFFFNIIIKKFLGLLSIDNSGKGNICNSTCPPNFFTNSDNICVKN